MSFIDAMERAEAEQREHMKRCEESGRYTFETGEVLKALAKGADRMERTWRARLLRFAAWVVSL